MAKAFTRYTELWDDHFTLMFAIHFMVGFIIGSVI